MSVLKLTSDEVRAAIGHLVDAKRLLNKCKEKIGCKAFMGNRVLDNLRDAWHEINCCRLYTESSVSLEGFTQTAMGNIVDAKEMLDSLIHWGKGLTPHGRLSILLLIPPLVWLSLSDYFGPLCRFSD